MYVLMTLKKARSVIGICSQDLTFLAMSKPNWSAGCWLFHQNGMMRRNSSCDLPLYWYIDCFQIPLSSFVQLYVTGNSENSGTEAQTDV